MPTLIFVVGVLLMAALVVAVPAAAAGHRDHDRGVGGRRVGVSTSGPGPRKGGWSLSVPSIPDSVGGLPDLSLVGEVDLFGAFSQISVFARVCAGVRAGAVELLRRHGHDDRARAGGPRRQGRHPAGYRPGVDRRGLGRGGRRCGVGLVQHGFVESASGIAEGARTGLANVVTGALFLVAMFLTPIYSIISARAVAPSLVGGWNDDSQVRNIDFTRFDIALP